MLSRDDLVIGSPLGKAGDTAPAERTAGTLVTFEVTSRSHLAQSPPRHEPVTLTFYRVRTTPTNRHPPTPRTGNVIPPSVPGCNMKMSQGLPEVIIRGVADMRRP